MAKTPPPSAPAAPGHRPIPGYAVYDHSGALRTILPATGGLVLAGAATARWHPDITIIPTKIR